MDGQHETFPAIAFQETMSTQDINREKALASIETLKRKEIRPTKEVLRAVDWDFTDVPSSTGIHSIHPYPAKFIRQIPRKLIESFHPGDSSLVLDPFCGSGTTLVEAIDLGLSALGIDVNPLACLLARVKTTPISSRLEDVAEGIAKAARRQLSRKEVVIPPIPRLNHWFQPDVQMVLSALVEQINQQNGPIKEAMQVALSSIIVQVSNQESDTRYAAVKKEITAQDVFRRFENAAAVVGKAVSNLSDNLVRRLGQAMVLNEDILRVTPEAIPRLVGLVVTSPPYPNAYEYWLYHKYRMYWLGMDPIAVRQHEIGARPHYFKSKPQDEKDFENQMSSVFLLLSQVMLPDAKACFLVGRSIIHGRLVDNVALMERAGSSKGFRVEGLVERKIPNSRKTFNPTLSNFNKEHLVVFGQAT